MTLGPNFKLFQAKYFKPHSSNSQINSWNPWDLKRTTMSCLLSMVGPTRWTLSTSYIVVFDEACFKNSFTSSFSLASVFTPEITTEYLLVYWWRLISCDYSSSATISRMNCSDEFMAMWPSNFKTLHSTFWSWCLFWQHLRLIERWVLLVFRFFYHHFCFNWR